MHNPAPIILKLLKKNQESGAGIDDIGAKLLLVAAFLLVALLAYAVYRAHEEQARHSVAMQTIGHKLDNHVQH